MISRVIQNKQKLQNSKSVNFLARFRINKKKKLGKMQKKIIFPTLRPAYRTVKFWA